jgi:hypothetical protein
MVKTVLENGQNGKNVLENGLIILGASGHCSRFGT